MVNCELEMQLATLQEILMESEALQAELVVHWCLRPVSPRALSGGVVTVNVSAATDPSIPCPMTHHLEQCYDFLHPICDWTLADRMHDEEKVEDFDAQTLEMVSGYSMKT